MEKKFAKRLKQILILAVALNLIIIIMQGISARKAIENSRKNLLLVGKTAISTFEGGRRARLLLNRNGAKKFRSFIDSIGEETGVKSLFLFDGDGNPLMNTRDARHPDFDPKREPSGAIDTDYGLFMYQTLPPMRHMMDMMKHPTSLHEDDTILVSGVLLDTEPHKKMIKDEFAFMAGMFCLELLLIAVYVYTARILRINADKSKKLEASEREAELGRMSRIMAHELKNPLSTVKGLMEFSAKKSEGELKDISESCVDELARLDRIINDYLSYGKDMTLNRTETNIRELADSTAKLLQIDAQAKDISINITGESGIVSADCEKMRQVLFNLMLNAVQGAPESSCIIIRVTDRHILVENSIKDADFDPAELGRPFYTTKTVGTGLGLAIVKRIVQLHGFEIRIDSDNLFSVEIIFD